MRKIISTVALVVALSSYAYAGEIQYDIASQSQPSTVAQIILFLSNLL